MIPFRMSQIKTQFLVCYLLSKTFSTNSAITKRKYVSKLMKSQPERFLSCLIQLSLVPKFSLSFEHFAYVNIDKLQCTHDKQYN